MPGLTPALASPTKRAVYAASPGTNGHHANGHKDLAEAIDGIQLSAPARAHPVPLNGGVNETVVISAQTVYLYASSRTDFHRVLLFADCSAV